MATNKPDDHEDQDDEPGPSSSKIPRLEHQNKVTILYDREDQDDEPGPSSSKIPESEHQNKVDHKKQIHNKLIAELTKFIFVGESGYERLLIRLEGYGLTPIDKVNCRKSESNLFDWMKRKGFIKVGKYDDLLEVLDKENEDASEIIRQYQARIEEISRKEEDSRQKPDDQPRSRCSNIEKNMHEKQATLSPELKVIEKRTLKRLERQLSSNTFVQTQAVTKGKQILHENRILIYTGLPGEGKTENALCVLNLLRQESTNNIYLKFKSLSEWKYVDPDLNLLILLDDCFGQSNANSNVINDDETWREIEDCIKEGKVRLILTIRKHIFVNNCTKLENNGTELFMKKNVIDLSSEGFCLTKENKKEILVKHCQSKNIEICKFHFFKGSEENLELADQTDCNLKISQHTLDEIVITDCPIGFPYTCYLFVSQPKYTKQGRRFFKKPLEHLKIDISELVSIKSGDLEKTQFCLMCYMMLKGGEINLKNQDQNMLDNIITSLKIKMPSEREKKEAIENLNHRYVIGDFPIFSFKHQTILECVALCFADDNIELLLQLCSTKFISEFMRPTDYEKKDGEEIIRLDQNDYKHVIKRLIKDLQGNYGYRSNWLATHPFLGDKQFVDSLIHEITLYKLCRYIRRLFGGNGFIDSCTFGYTYFTDKLYNELHVDISNVDTGKALEEACKRGHTETVMWLLNSNIKTDNVIGAMVAAPTDTLTSMLNHQNITQDHVKEVLTYHDLCMGYVRCSVNNCMRMKKFCHYKTVDVLLNRWPEMDFQFLLKLFNACIDNDIDKTVQLFISRKLDVIQSRLTDCIQKACYKGSMKVLKLIINKMPQIITKQNIKTKKILNESFTLACAGEQIKIVEYLLGLKDRDIDNESIYLSVNHMNVRNLHVAAYLGNFEILKKLIAVGVDVSCISKTNMSVLSYAIEGYVYGREIVTKNEEYSYRIELYAKRNEITNRLPSILKKLQAIKMNKTMSDYAKVLDHLIQLDGINLTDLDMILDKNGSTLAHHLTLNKNIDTIKLLLSKYKKVMFSKTSCDMTCLHIAAFRGYFDIFKVLVEEGLSIKDRDESHRSVLQYVIMGYIYEYNRDTGGLESNSSLFILKRNFAFDKKDGLQIVTHILQSNEVSLKELEILDNRGMALVHYLVFFKHAEIIQILTDRYRKSVLRKTSKGLTCLHIAAFFGKVDVFEMLVNAGLELKDQDKADRSVLRYAVMGYRHNTKYIEDLESDFSLFVSRNEFSDSLEGNRQILTYLIQSSDVSLEELDKLDNRGMSLVHYCVLCNDVKTIELLVRSNIKSVSCRTKKGLTCLHIAAFFGHFDVFKALVEAGLSIKDRDESDRSRSVLEYVIMGYMYAFNEEKEDVPPDLDLYYTEILYFGQKDLRKTLNYILHNSDVSIEELDMSVLHYCVVLNEVENIQLLLERFSKTVLCKTSDGCLHIAAYFGCVDAFEVFVNAGQSIEARDELGISVFQYAIMGYKYHCCRINRYDSSKFWELESIFRHRYVLNEDRLQILRYIIQSKDVCLEDLDILDHHGWALIHYCVLLDHVETIKLIVSSYKLSVLCRTKESIYYETNVGMTCLHITAFIFNFDAFKVLVEAGLSIKDRDELGNSVLQYAIMGYKYVKNNDETYRRSMSVPFQELLDMIECYRGLNIQQDLPYILQSYDISLEELDKLDHHGIALVHYCVLFNDIETIKILVNRYEKTVVRRTKEGLTCLHIAAFVCYFDEFMMLLDKAGLSIKDKDKSDRSVLQYAIMGYRYYYSKKKDDLESDSFLFYLCNHPFSDDYWLEDNLQILTYILQSDDISLDELDILDNHGMALVHYCVLFNNVETIQLLLKKYEESVFCRTKEGLTCLHIAAFCGNLQLYEVLMTAGLSTKDFDNLGRCILQYATMGRSVYEKSDYKQLSLNKFEDKIFDSLHWLRFRWLEIEDRRHQFQTDFQKIINYCTN